MGNGLTENVFTFADWHCLKGNFRKSHQGSNPIGGKDSPDIKEESNTSKNIKTEKRPKKLLTDQDYGARRMHNLQYIITFKLAF